MSIQSLSHKKVKRTIIKILVLFISSFFIYYLLTSSVRAQDDTEKSAEAIKYSRLGDSIRKNRINVGDIYSVSARDGRFHIIHVDKLFMDCRNCHSPYEYKPDYLIVSKYNTLPPKHKGHIEKSVCMGCHQPGGMGTAWYSGSTKKDTDDD
ncbi:hypothetical protein [uncultured Photobacterium sp.]|uniref:hypothetical protein n=1 Tax=uncultured Photobacterium sp. TaxID=173973 RepID=UPI00261E6BE1|nr:hypothetical protein [uncultured Photobacterium sp.]